MEVTGPILVEISVRELEAHIRNLEGVRHPESAPQAHEAAAQYVWERLQASGCKMEAVFFKEGDRTYRNICGVQAGRLEPDQYLVVMAHFDTVSNSPGADDNASGVAALLELARVFQYHPLSQSILFCGVDLEEQAVEGEQGTPILRGSRALAAYFKENGWQIGGVVNFESVAYAGDEIPQSTPENLPIQLPEAGNFIGVIGNEKSIDLVRGYCGVIDEHQIPLPYLPMVVPGNGELLPDTRRSDHASFWDAGYPAVMLTDTANFRNPHYHQPSDRLETLNLNFLREVCRAAGALVLKMAG